MFKKMRMEEDDWSETSSYREFEIYCESFAKENHVQKPIIRVKHSMDLKELNRLQAERTSKATK